MRARPMTRLVRLVLAVFVAAATFAASAAVAVPSGAQEQPPPPVDFNPNGEVGIDGNTPLVIGEVDANSPGSETDGPSYVSRAPSPYAECTFRIQPLVSVIESYFAEVFDPSVVQTIRDNAYQGVEDGTTTGENTEPNVGGFFGFFQTLINLMLDYLHAHAHFLELAGDDLSNMNQNFVLVECPPGSIRQDVYVWREGDPPPASLVDAYRDQAYDETRIPGLGVNSAPSGSDDQPLVVNIDTWLWSSPALWGPVTANAGIPGVVEVTTTATPIVTQWDPGNGQPPVVCDGPGQPWSPDLGAVAEPDCAVRYTSSSSTSPTGTFTLTRTTRWNVSWSCAPACGGGVLDPILVSESRQVPVAEIQAVVTDA